MRQVRQVRSGLNKAHPAQARQVLRWGYRGERARALGAVLRPKDRAGAGSGSSRRGAAGVGKLTYVNGEKGCESRVMVNQETSTKPKGRGGRPKGLGPTPSSWKPGQTGNPSGKPPSAAGRVARSLMAAADGVREELAERIVQQALAGCVQSQRLLIERFGPAPVRAQTAAQALPGIEHGSIEERLQVVLQAAAEGRVSADEAKVLIDGIRGATEAAAIAAAERELQAIRNMRKQVALQSSALQGNALQGNAIQISNAHKPHQNALESTQAQACRVNGV